MRTIMLGTKVVQEEIVIDLSCNNCGKCIEGINEPVDEMYGMDITPVKISFGYGSSRDGDNIEFDLCDDCIDTMIKQFKIPATLTKTYQV